MNTSTGSSGRRSWRRRLGWIEAPGPDGVWPLFVRNEDFAHPSGGAIRTLGP